MSLGPVLTTVLLLGSAPPSGIHSHEQDGHHLAPSPDTFQESQDVRSGPVLIPPPIEQTQTVRECPDTQGRLTLEAISRMAADGAFSVWDVTGGITLRSEVQALRRLIVYHGMHSRDPSRTHVLLQVELTPSRTSEFQQVTQATLLEFHKRHDLQVWQEPASACAGPRLLLMGVLDLHKLQTLPHDLELKGGGGNSVTIAILENIMLR